MAFLIKYDSYPDKFSEVRMELGSPDQFQTIQLLEKIPPPEIAGEEQDLPKEYEILFKVVNNKDNTITSHSMEREELGEYIDILKRLLSQSKQ